MEPVGRCLMTLIARASALGILFTFSATTSGRGDDVANISEIKHTLAAGQCPPQHYFHIRYDDRNCGWSGQKACDDKFSAPSQQWQDCYHELAICHQKIDDDNKVLDQANHAWDVCNAKKASDSARVGSKPTGTGASDLSALLHEAQDKNAAAKAEAVDDRKQILQGELDAVANIQQRIDQAVAKCVTSYDRDIAECSGNTNQYRREVTFPAAWINQVDAACRNKSLAEKSVCQNRAKGDPDSQDPTLRRSAEMAEQTYRNVSNSLSSYVQQAQPADGGAPVYSPSYSGQAPANQRRPPTTTAPFIAAPTYNPNVPSPVHSGSSGAPNCPYQVCTVH